MPLLIDADRMANIVDPDLTDLGKSSRSSLIGVYTVCAALSGPKTEKLQYILYQAPCAKL